jgi:hypothetical protein
MPDWVFPWLLAGLAIWPLIHVERWIHKHIQGLGLLLTNDPQAAVLIYYLVLLPGVALHELSQWVLAKILLVKVKKFRLWPEKQGDLIRLGLVEIDRKVDVVRTTLIGIIPLVTGIAAIALIASRRFDTEALIASLTTGDVPTMAAGLGAFMSAPDFWLWLYLVFAIANAMLPEPHDEVNWWMLGGVVVAIFIFLWVLDLRILIEAGLEGPLAQLARWLSLVLVMALVLDLVGMGLIAAAEALFSRLLGRELEYR